MSKLAGINIDEFISIAKKANKTITSYFHLKTMTRVGESILSPMNTQILFRALVQEGFRDMVRFPNIVRKH